MAFCVWGRWATAGDCVSSTDSGASAPVGPRARAWIPNPFKLFEAFRARVEPLLPTRVAIVLLLAAMGLAGTGLHLATRWLTDDATIRHRIAEGFAANAVYNGEIEATDRFSECMSLSILARETGRTGLPTVMRMEALQWDGRGPLCRSVADALEGGPTWGWFPYGRYWHGKLNVDRIWLDHFDYASLTQATQAAAIISALLFGLALAWRVSTLTAVVTVGLGLGISDLIAVSVQPTQGVSLTALFLGAAGFVALGRRRIETLCLAAVAAGAAYNYFDFLYNPGLLAGLLGWSVVLMGLGDTDRRELAWRAAAVSIMVLVGFVGMWAAKWSIAVLYMIGSFDFFWIVTPFHVTAWTMGGDKSVWPLEATAIVTEAAFRAWWTAPVMIAALAASIGMAWRRGAIGALWAPAVPLLITVLTLEAASGHTVSHGSPVRAIPWLLAALCGAAAYLAERGRTVTTISPAPASQPA